MSLNFKDKYEDIKKGMKELNAVIPGAMEGFGMLHKSTIGKGALTSKTKELIALGIAITVRCDGCIAFHVHDAISAGATPAEIQETIGVSIMMGGGPSLVYGCEAMEALKQFQIVEA